MLGELAKRGVRVSSLAVFEWVGPLVEPQGHDFCKVRISLPFFDYDVLLWSCGARGVLLLLL